MGCGETEVSLLALLKFYMRGGSGGLHGTQVPSNFAHGRKTSVSWLYIMDSAEFLGLSEYLFVLLSEDEQASFTKQYDHA